MRSLALAAPLLFAAARAAAHDFWIEPSTFHPGPGTVVAVGLRVGQDFIGDPVPRLSSTIRAFSVRQNGADQDVGGTDRLDPAGMLRAEGDATAIISYVSLGSAIELPADRFEAYLRLYGLDEVIASRAERGESRKPGRERFYRYAKALLAGQASSPDVVKPLGLDFEIVPDDDPTRRFEPFSGRVLYRGKPLVHAQVSALLFREPDVRFHTLTDAAGAFSFSLPRSGIWLIKSVHIERAWFFASEDWDSQWASLTFEMPAAKPEPSP